MASSSTHWVIPQKDRVPWAEDTKKHSAAFKLFHYPFGFRIAKLHLMDPNFIAQFGHLTTGHPETDRLMAQEEISIIKTIAEMVDFHKEGVGFRLQDPKDGVRMYEIIHRHLQDWKEAMERSFQPLNVPINDLKAIDNFAKDLYVVARGYVQPTTQSLGLSAYFAQVSQSRGTQHLRGFKSDLEKEQEQIYQSQHKEQSSHLSNILRQRQHRFSNG